MNFDELEPGVRMRGADRGVRGLDQRGFAHAARAPQQRVVGRQAAGEALGILDQKIAHPVDALEQRHLDTVDAADRARAVALRDARRRLRRRQKSGAGRRRRGQPFQRVGDPLEDSRRCHRAPGALSAARRRRALAALFRSVEGDLAMLSHRFPAFPLAGRRSRSQAAAGSPGATLQLGHGGYSPRRFPAQNRPFIVQAGASRAARRSNVDHARIRARLPVRPAATAAA